MYIYIHLFSVNHKKQTLDPEENRLDLETALSDVVFKAFLEQLKEVSHKNEILQCLQKA